MSRYDLLYSEADMLDAFYAGRQKLLDEMGKVEQTEHPFHEWIEQLKNTRKEEVKELKDDEMDYEARMEAKELLNDESND